MNRGIDGYYHVLYKTINLINEHFYVGIHSTRILEDGYLGSGKRVKAEINKYGKENFKREILEFCGDRISLVSREKEIVNEELRSNELCLNLTNGGDGNFFFCNAVKTPEQRTKAGLAGGFANQDKWSEDIKEKVKKQRKENGRKKFAKMCEEVKEGKRKNWWIGRTLTEEHKQNRKETFKEIGHSQGEKNSQFGTCWITHESLGSRKCRKEQLPKFLNQGWIKGRASKNISQVNLS